MTNGDIENYGKSPAWWDLMGKMYRDESRPSQEQFEIMKVKLLNELKRLL